MCELMPFVKWAGGKRQIQSHILKSIEKVYKKKNTYYEPFLGGGAIFLALKPSKAVLNDINYELINSYQIIRDEPERLINELKKMKRQDSKDKYYEIREWDRSNRYHTRKAFRRAARMIYLNKTCFNGLYRVNNSGYFNTPRGKYNNPAIYDESNIYALSNYFKKSKIDFNCKDYKQILTNASEGDVIYFDPPYDYHEEGFTKYTINGFTRDDLVELKKTCDSLIMKGCHVFISNNKTDRVEELFNDAHYEIEYIFEIIKANRNINCKGKERAKVEEVLIHGFPK